MIDDWEALDDFENIDIDKFEIKKVDDDLEQFKDEKKVELVEKVEIVESKIKPAEKNIKKVVKNQKEKKHLIFFIFYDIFFYYKYNAIFFTNLFNISLNYFLFFFF